MAEQALARVNYHREKAGAPPMRLNGSLIETALAHSRYMVLNNFLTHIETNGNPGFTGVEPGDRATAQGYQSTNVWEGIGFYRITSSGQIVHREPRENVDDQISGPFHRVAPLFSKLNDYGYGEEKTSNGTYYYTCNYGSLSWGDLDTVVYPGDGQTDVPLLFPGHESPDPFPDAMYPVGYAVTLFTSLYSGELKIQNYSLKPVGGTNLSVYTFMPSSSSGFPYVFAMASKDPLKPGTEYEAHIEAIAAGKAFNKTWRFTTTLAPAGKTLDRLVDKDWGFKSWQPEYPLGNLFINGNRPLVPVDRLFFLRPVFELQPARDFLRYREWNDQG